MASRSRYSNGSARRKLRARVRDMGLPCAICGCAIDYSLPAGDPWSYELDERVPVKLGGSPIDPANVQPAHRICNERKGAKLRYEPRAGARGPERERRVTSLDW